MADASLTSSWDIGSAGSGLTPLSAIEDEPERARDDVALTSAAYEIAGRGVDGATTGLLVWEPLDLPAIPTDGGSGDDTGSETTGAAQPTLDIVTISGAARPVTIGLDDGQFDGDGISGGTALVEPIVLGGVSGSVGDVVQAEYSYSLEDEEGVVINVYALSLNGTFLGLSSDAPITLGNSYVIVEQPPAPLAILPTLADSYVSPTPPADETPPGAPGQLIVTLDGQAGGYNGYFLVKITDPDGTQRIDVLTDNYDRDIGKTFVVDVGVGATVRTGFTVANGANTIWSNNEFAASARNSKRRLTALSAWS